MQKLYSNKVELDTSASSFGKLCESQDILDNHDALKERLNNDGYLFFRELIPKQEVLKARKEILLKYAIIGQIDASYPIENAIQQSTDAIEKVNLRAFAESVRSGIAYTKVVEHPNIFKVFEGLLGGPIKCYDFRWPRFVRPNEGCGIHCDGPYMNRGSDKVFTCWIPLGDVAMHEGGLIVLEKKDSHETMLKNYFAKDADRDKIEWLSTNPVKLQKRLDARWLSADYKAGDVLLFTMKTVHGALDNRSPEGRCRLSSDTRYQIASEPLDERWNGTKPKAHGYDKVFFPGLGNWRNKEFKDEWKSVDSQGRLILED